MSNKPNWPEHVETLCADDICRGTMTNHKGQHCLLGWARHQFGGMFGDLFAQMCRALEDEVVGESSVPGYTDSPDNSLEDIARLYNRALASVGYDVPKEVM